MTFLCKIRSALRGGGLGAHVHIMEFCLSFLDYIFDCRFGCKTVKKDKYVHEFRRQTKRLTDRYALDIYVDVSLDVPYSAVRAPVRQHHIHSSVLQYAVHLA